MARMVLEVRGVPDIDPSDRMVDQLKIHFLRRSNNGDDVLEVLYPTSTPGQAYVIFESEKVPGVLQCTHVLEVDSRFYPVHVQRARQSEVDMGVETTLDISMFPNPREALQLIEEHGFEVTKPSTGRLHLKGSFLNLKLLRKKLTHLLAQGVPLQSRSPPALSNGYSSASSAPVSRSEPDRLEDRYIAKSSSKYGHLIGNGVHVWNRSPVVDGASVLSGVSPASLTRPQPTSPVHGDSDSPRSLPNLHADSYSRPTSSRREASVLVDRDILDYALVYREDVFKEMNMNYGAEMSVIDDKDITVVKFLGINCQKAQAKLQALIEDIGPKLRKQEINLKEYRPVQQKQIRDRIQHYKDWGVVIKQDDDTIKLVGTSTRSFLVMQMLLGMNDDPSTSSQRGRELERGSRLRRSSSLQREHRVSSVRETDQGRSPKPDYQASAAKDYSPSHYQEEDQSRREPQKRPPNEQPGRRRSSSVDRHKYRETREQPKQIEPLLLPSGGEEKTFTTKKTPTIKKSLGAGLNKLTSDFINKTRLKKVSLL
ncbi:uncharacterized protein si:dkey-154b15.1 [Colossoma macropomum]|uniref:uncharacterized protein si:dkey-154b15.1 n=1 Tax=Colossoma macropomum TaxID=42526 RepID=UPI00186486F9|nr:uncharacterized protein si:dkey-154b15.1 [Colossoma macropomum]XP_036421854.1 uncharacterized protein si:dkey-154b15.1 [Colossoma macropomum]XP_036421856.1 uncharacterized protein si:dkey-154b15.1 [Colossoma macropomum]